MTTQASSSISKLREFAISSTLIAGIAAGATESAVTKEGASGEDRSD